MIFDKIKEKAFVHSNVRLEMDVVRTRIQKIHETSSLIAISPTPTIYNWLGVNRATHNIFPDSSFDIPQYYSRTVYSDNELKEIANIITDLNFDKIIFSGFCDYFEFLISLLKSLRPNIFIALIYHGSLSELAGNQKMKNDFIKIIELIKKKKIDRIGFVKKGLDICINKIFHLESYPLLIPPPDISDVIHEKADRRKNIHIGIFANNQLRKNTHNQIAAALMIDNAMIHTTDKFEYSYFDCNNRIIEHPSCLKWNDLMFLLFQMDINLYNTYTETWGQIVVESLALGVPCLTNNSSGLLDINEQLKKYLVVSEHDNPLAIAESINYALRSKEEIIRLGNIYINDLKKCAQIKLNAFIN